MKCNYYSFVRLISISYVNLINCDIFKYDFIVKCEFWTENKMKLVFVRLLYDFNQNRVFGGGKY